MFSVSIAVSIGPRVSRGWWLPLGLTALIRRQDSEGFNRAARFARLVAKIGNSQVQRMG